MDSRVTRTRRAGGDCTLGEYSKDAGIQDIHHPATVLPDEAEPVVEHEGLGRQLHGLTTRRARMMSWQATQRICDDQEGGGAGVVLQVRGDDERAVLALLDRTHELGPGHGAFGW
ncbi:hypothetical protein [Streptomyces barringtoniae]|uniref:hypothetical protein n=1 Tax=Streptomyces barringtoniae TaxID=2892029 RepID=UPI001E36A6BE|nr:hypothetical protein [Streptomyces barringtoniae]MCC5476550.1 hypothetical protein [Streptomyces barringtoniae]